MALLNNTEMDELRVQYFVLTCAKAHECFQTEQVVVAHRSSSDTLECLVVDFGSKLNH